MSGGSDDRPTLYGKRVTTEDADTVKYLACWSETFQEQLDNLKRKFATMTAGGEMIDEEQTIFELRKKVCTLTQEKEALTQENETLKQENKEAVTQENEKLKASLQKKEEENGQLKASLQQKGDDNHRLTNQIETVRRLVAEVDNIVDF